MTTLQNSPRDGQVINASNVILGIVLVLTPFLFGFTQPRALGSTEG
jgi:hypothetical protein